jgi:hypothetical protein
MKKILLVLSLCLLSSLRTELHCQQSQALKSMRTFFLKSKPTTFNIRLTTPKVNSNYFPAYSPALYNKKIIVRPSKTPMLPLNRSVAKTYISIPANKLEFKNIFGKEISAEVRSTLNLYERLAIEKQITHNYTFTKSATEFMESITTSQAKVVTIIGHNENGKIMFPDGSSELINKIAQVAESSNKTVVFLSCHSTKYTTSPGVKSLLTFSEAINIQKHIYSKLPLGLSLKFSQAELSDEIKKDIAGYVIKQTGKKYAKRTVAGVSGGGGLYMLYLDNRTSKQLKPPPLAKNLN